MEEHEIEIGEAGDRLDGRFRIGRLAHDLDTAGRLEHSRQPLQGQRLVVDEKHPPHDAASVSASGAASGAAVGAGPGRSIVTPAPAETASGAMTRAVAPYKASSRARRLSSPWPGTQIGPVNPGPSSVISRRSRSPSRRARTTICAPALRADPAYLTLFSTTVWMANAGIIAPCSSPGTS